MALRDQPYLPLYVQDFLTDERLNECSAASQGVYIKIMCIFHKSETYGGILLKQKDKQSENNCLNFANKLSNLLTFNFITIQTALEELLEEQVLRIDGDLLFQKRMVNDNGLSIKRSEIGSKGGKKTQSKNRNFAKAKHQANTENENENENENIIEVKKCIYPTIEQVKKYCFERNNSVDSETWFNFYSSKGWMIGKNKMKDWKAAVRTWEKNKPQNGREQKQQLGNISNSGVGDDYRRSILERLQSAGGK